MSGRGGGQTEPATGPPHPLKLISLLLQHPDDELLAAREELCAAASELPGGGQAEAIRTFAEWWASLPADDLRARYVETFDFDRRSSLYLTYHLFGDRRQRGMALLRLKERYAAEGLELGPDELPDYLPAVLEFAAIAPEPGLEILHRHRESIELIRASLHDEGSPWASLLDAVVMPLPGMTRRQLARVRRLAEQGPPEEEVGLEPFAPPEVMPEPVGEAPR
jgi:nitrate reductase molybdenum cofactor assembly chaperone NarJ/NarW